MKNEMRLWYCDIYDRTISFTSRLRHVNSKSHKGKKEYGTVVGEYEFIKREMDEVIYILNDTIEDCRNKDFHSFEYRCVKDFKFINMENNEEVFLTIVTEYKKFNFQFHGLNKKNRICVQNGLRFSEIVN